MNQAKVAKFVLQNGPVHDKIRKEIREITSTHLFKKISHKTYDQVKREVGELLDSYIEQQLINDYEFDLDLNITNFNIKIF